MVTRNTSQIKSLLQGVQWKQDPRLYELLRFILGQVNQLNDEVFGPEATATSVISSVLPGDVTNFNYSLLSEAIYLSWTAVSNADLYIVKKGTDWDTADLLTITPSTNVAVEPQLAGSHRYLIKAATVDNLESLNATLLDVLISPIGAISVSARVIDNNVLLQWTIPTSPFRLIYYEVYKNGVVIGRNDGTFSAVFESVSDTYEYGIKAYDIAGNVSALYTTVATVSQPPDYILEDQYTSTLGGTRVNTHRDTIPALYACVDITETWQQHFTSRGWNTLQDQINAGFPYYLQPTKETGSYEEIKDYGLIISNVVVSIDYSSLIIVPNVNVTVKMAVSDDGITYTSFITGNSVFFASVRYLKFRFEFQEIA